MKQKTSENSRFNLQVRRTNVRWALVGYDLVIFTVSAFLMFVLHPSTSVVFSSAIIHQQSFLAFVCIFGARFVLDVYRQIWRYGGITAYIRLIAADWVGGVVYVLANYILPIGGTEFIRQFSLVCLNLLGAVIIRMVYHYLYDYVNRNTAESSFLSWILSFFGGLSVKNDLTEKLSVGSDRRIKVAIVGAGRTGIALCEDLLNNPSSIYHPVIFVDKNARKVGRTVMSIPVMAEGDITRAFLANLGVQEVFFALPSSVQGEELKRLYDYYESTGCRVKRYDYPTLQSARDGKRTLREFNIEDLLPRQTVDTDNTAIAPSFTGKTVLITGGGGSIGSELCRQIAEMRPACLVVADIAENTTYDLQQEFLTKHKDSENGLKLCIEIVNVCDRNAMDKLFRTYQPEIVIHAAAHKHVPLMEHNCCEAVKNNVFGTKNVVDMAVRHGVERFTLISSDKAVNPTNIMGATKRICEMLVMHAAANSGTVFTAVRFGNVMGSAGSVIPLFRKQIAAGGPITITDKRIIRYFMTIPEATHLVLEASSMAESGELFVLDMGQPVRILEVAENMIRLSGLRPYEDIDIVEIGLRPGEKLYEELLISGENLQKTSNNLIFVEKDEPLSTAQVDTMLSDLKASFAEEDDSVARAAVIAAVPTFIIKSAQTAPGEVTK